MTSIDTEDINDYELENILQQKVWNRCYHGSPIQINLKSKLYRICSVDVMVKFGLCRYLSSRNRDFVIFGTLRRLFWIVKLNVYNLFVVSVLTHLIQLNEKCLNLPRIKYIGNIGFKVKLYLSWTHKIENSWPGKLIIFTMRGQNYLTVFN